MKELFVIIFCFVVCLLALIGINKLNNNYKYVHNIETIEKVVNTTDTIYMRDTVVINKPKLVYKRVVDTIYLPKDTVLSVIEKSYSDSTYCAIVEGVQYDSLPRLKEISVFPKKQIITNEKVVYQYLKPKKKIRFVPSVGIGFYHGEIVPSVGIGIVYN